VCISCVVDALPGQCLRRRSGASPLVAAVFRTKRLQRERCSATCQRRRRPGQARRRQGRLQITADLFVPDTRRVGQWRRADRVIRGCLAAGQGARGENLRPCGSSASDKPSSFLGSELAYFSVRGERHEPVEAAAYHARERLIGEMGFGRPGAVRVLDGQGIDEK
jgi:hypothetical protein